MRKPEKILAWCIAAVLACGLSPLCALADPATDDPNPLAGDPATPSTDGMAKAKALIESLPLDPIRISSADADAIQQAQDAYNALSAADQAQLDSDMYQNLTYGRILEQAVWALDAQAEVDNSCSLANGTYTGKVDCTTNPGKNTSARQVKFSVKKITVSDGRATALLEYGGSSSDYLIVGGKRYQHVNTDEGQNSQFEVPINLNATMHVVSFAKNPGPTTVGISYEIQTSIDEATAKPDAAPPDNKDTTPAAPANTTPTSANPPETDPEPPAENPGTPDEPATSESSNTARATSAGTATAAARTAVSAASSQAADSKTADEAKTQSAKQGKKNATAIDVPPEAAGGETDQDAVPPAAVATFPIACLFVGSGGFIAWFKRREKTFKMPEWVCG